MGRKYRYNFTLKNQRFLLVYVKYIKEGKSELFDSNLENKNQKNRKMASYLWNIGLRFMNNRECGALEVADILLNIFLYTGLIEISVLND